MLEERSLSGIEEAEALLRKCGLTVNNKVDYTVGIFDEEELIATGSLSGDMIQMLAVLPERKGEDLSAAVVTHLIKYALTLNIKNLHLFTKVENINMFIPLGFSTVAIARPYAALLEWGRPGIEEYCSMLKSQAGGLSGDASAIVMNCNPFTLGHQYLIEAAAARSSKVFVLVVQEELSTFPFDVRYRLIREGTAHLPNVRVIPGGRYVVSALTFPSYFTKDTQLANAHCAVDVEVFIRHIAPALGIKRRYIGTEPLSPVTEIYNITMKERLIPEGIDVIELPRLEKAGEVISASRVRSLLSQGKLEAVKELVPVTTYDYLASEAAVPVLNKLMKE